MTLLNILKRSIVWPLSRTVPTVKVGLTDSWRIVIPRSKRPFVIAAGVGKSITFEIDLARRWNADVVLLDPTPTGVETMRRLGAKLSGLRYLQVGLAAEDGVQSFSPPADAEEGSFSVTRLGDLVTTDFECVCLTSLLRDAGRDSIDILKMDIEGFEYGVLDRMLTDQIPVDQLCIELHVAKSSGAAASLLDAVLMLVRLYLAGYRIVYNKGMDFTLVSRSVL